MGIRAFQVIALGALLLGVSAYLIPYGFQLQDNWNKALRGELVPFPVNYTEPFTVQMGGIYVHTTIEQSNIGFDLQRYFNFNNMVYPFQISFKDAKLFVSAEIRDKNGDLVAKITDNQWSVNNNPVIADDRNYNAYAFEVMDSDLIPILQIAMTPQNTIFAGGVFHSINGTLPAMLNGTTITNPRKSTIENYNQTIFQYPSDSHLSELVPNSPFAFKPTPTIIAPIWVIIIGVIILIIGTILTSSGVADKLRKKKPRRTGRRSKKQRKSAHCNLKG